MEKRKKKDSNIKLTVNKFYSQTLLTKAYTIKEQKAFKTFINAYIINTH